MTRIIIAVFLALMVTACWQSDDMIYGAEDYFLPFKGDVVSLSDSHGPLGIYQVNGRKQYTPLHKTVAPNGPEQIFRTLDIGFVPVDRMAAYGPPKADWQTQSKLSRSVFPDGDTQIYAAIAGRRDEPGQTLSVTLVQGEFMSLCRAVLVDGFGLHDEFEQFANMKSPDSAFVRKSGIAMLVLNEVSSAKRKNKLDCERYKVATHETSDLPKLIEATERGDRLRKAYTQRRAEQTAADAVRKAEANNRRIEAQRQQTAQPAPQRPAATSRQQLAKLNQDISDLQRSVYEINDALDGKLWGTLNGVGGKVYGVDRVLTVNGLKYQSKMTCRSLSGYASVYLTVTHDASPGTNAKWVMRSGEVPLQIETDNGRGRHNAKIQVVGSTQYTNTLQVIFSDLKPSNRSVKYMNDPALLERTRRQAEMFGTSVEALTRIGFSFISLEEAQNAETYKIYAEIFQNGARRTVLLGDLGKGSDSDGMSGFIDACLF